MNEQEWGLAIELGADGADGVNGLNGAEGAERAEGVPLGVRAAVAENGRIRLLAPAPADGPVGSPPAGSDPVGTVLALAVRARGDRGAAPPARLTVIGSGGGGGTGDEVAGLREAARLADLPEPELLTPAVAAARYFRSALAFPPGTEVIVLTLDERAGSAAAVANPANAATAGDALAAGALGWSAISLAGEELDRRFVDLVVSRLRERSPEATTGGATAAALGLSADAVRQAREALSRRSSVVVAVPGSTAESESESELYVTRGEFTRATADIVGAAVAELREFLVRLRPAPGALAGIFLVGAAARVAGLAARIRADLGCTVFVADRPDVAVLGALATPDDDFSAFFEDEASAAAELPSDLSSLPGISGVADVIAATTGVRALTDDAAPPPAEPPIDLLHGAETATNGRSGGRGTGGSRFTADTGAGAPVAASWAATRQGSGPGGGSGPLPPPAPVPEAGRSRAVLAVLAVVFIALVAAGGYALADHMQGGHGSSVAVAGTSASQTPAGPTFATATAASPLPPTDSGAVTPTDSGSLSASPSPSAHDPAATVLAYFAAINAQDYQLAWNLGGKNLDTSYPHFVAGFDDTSNDSATAQDVGATTASIQLTATHDDGSVQDFAGTFTVVDGVITGAKIEQVN